MAMAIHKWCQTCDTQTLHIDGACVPCAEKERWLVKARWNALEPREQIADLLKRIEKLERTPRNFLRR